METTNFAKLKEYKSNLLNYKRKQKETEQQIKKLEDVITGLEFWQGILGHELNYFTDKIAHFDIITDDYVHTCIGTVANIVCDNDHKDVFGHWVMHIYMNNCIEMKKYIGTKPRAVPEQVMAWNFKDIYVNSETVVNYKIVEDQKELKNIQEALTILTIKPIKKDNG